MKVLVAIGDLWGHRRMYDELIERYDLIRIFKTETATPDLLDCVEVGLVGFHFEQRRPDRLLTVLRDYGIPTILIRGIHPEDNIEPQVLEKTKRSYLEDLGCREFIDLDNPAIDTQRVINALEEAAHNKADG